jgi:Sulfatase
MRAAAKGSRGVLSRLGTLLFSVLNLVVCGCNRSPTSLATAGTSLVADRAELERIAIDSETRSVLRGKTHHFAVTVPADAELDVGFGVPGTGRAWKLWPSDIERVAFTVAFAHDGTRETLAQRRIERPPDGATQWHDLTLDLRPLAGRRGSLILEADAYPPAAFLQPTPAVFGGIPVSIPRLPPVVWTIPRLRQPSANAPTNLILISIDTLRADHLGCYGYHRPTSPNVDRMAAEGVLFRNAVASSPWTLPSHASMLTGLDPARHGAVKFVFVPMSHSVDTLAELLWDVGYETAAFVGGGFVSNFFGFSRGFDRFWENPARQTESDSLKSIVDLGG